MASQTDDFNKIKLFIESELGSDSLLLSWDTALPLRALIAEICSQWSMKNPESFALKYTSSNQRYFLTDENRKELKSGQQLHLSSSPKKLAEEVKHFAVINTDEAREKCYNLLKQYSKDPIFITAFLAIDGIHFLIESIQKEIINSNPDEQLIKVNNIFITSLLVYYLLFSN